MHASGLGGDFVTAQERLENTIMYWSAMLGFYGNITGTMQSQIEALMNGSAGPAPAWSLLLSSELYDNNTGMFGMTSNYSTAESTADAAVLTMLLSTVPVNGSLAVPMDDSVYEDINNVIDGGLSNVNLATKTLTVSVAKPGTFLSMLGTDVLEYNLNCSGVWQLDFSGDWNSITHEVLLSPLPASRLYLGATAPTNVTINASDDDHCSISPIGLVEVGNGGSQTFTYSADSGCEISQVLVDGFPAPITGTYTFNNVQSPHTISVSSTLLPPTFTPPELSATPTTSPTVSPTSSPPQVSSSSPSATPVSSRNPSPTSSSPSTVSLPLILGASISVAALLAVSLSLPIYLKKRRTTPVCLH